MKIGPRTLGVKDYITLIFGFVISIIIAFVLPFAENVTTSGRVILFILLNIFLVWRWKRHTQKYPDDPWDVKL